MNSIGSSTVMMWPFISLFTLSISAASVVLFPEPVGPVTSTSPRGRSASFATLARHDVQVRRLPLDHLLEQGAEIDRRHRAARHAAVSFTTSSRVVTPFFTLIIPSIRSVSILSLTPCSRSSSVEAPFNTRRRSAEDMAITSYRPWRPLYPVPLHVSQPVPLKKGPSFGSTPKACISSGEY